MIGMVRFGTKLDHLFQNNGLVYTKLPFESWSPRYQGFECAPKLNVQKRKD